MLSISGPLPASNVSLELKLFDEDRTVAAHYRGMRQHRGSEGCTDCYLLHAGLDNEVVGFLGLVCAVEDLDPELHIYYSVDYVFVRKLWRGKGASLPLRDFTQNIFTSHLEKTYTENKAAGLRLKVHSASCFQSDDGARFVRAVDKALRAMCNRLGIGFDTSVDDG